MNFRGHEHWFSLKMCLFIQKTLISQENRIITYQCLMKYELSELESCLKRVELEEGEHGRVASCCQQRQNQQSQIDVDELSYYNLRLGSRLLGVVPTLLFNVNWGYLSSFCLISYFICSPVLIFILVFFSCFSLISVATLMFDLMTGISPSLPYLILVTLFPFAHVFPFSLFSNFPFCRSIWCLLSFSLCKVSFCNSPLLLS